jgi:sigma-B regulation protein RsbU (phosphoserine phosphatase)
MSTASISSWWPTSPGWPWRTELLQEDMRRHERLDRQLSIGAEIQAQLLPDRCPVIEGVELAARCRPAFQVGGDYYDFIPTRPQLTGRRREQGPAGPW